MKKIFVVIMLMLSAISTFAQLKVKSNGRIVAGSELQTSSYFNVGLQSGIQLSNSDSNVALYGRADNLNNYGASYGVYGVATNSLYGRNFGVIGMLDNSSNGAGVYGCTFVQGGVGFSSQYAGYFWGNTYVNGNAKKLSGVNFNMTMPDGSWNEQYGYGLVDAYSSVINTPSTVYIQNDTITGTRIISAENIYVGRNVTNTSAYGDVTLGQGDITLKADYVEIKNSTTIPLGTTLKIEN